MQCESGDPAGLRLSKSNVRPARMPAYRLNQTRRSSAMLCLSLSICPPEDDPAGAGNQNGLKTLSGYGWSDMLRSYLRIKLIGLKIISMIEIINVGY